MKINRKTFKKNVLFFRPAVEKTVLPVHTFQTAWNHAIKKNFFIKGKESSLKLFQYETKRKARQSTY